jgi:hypothetical protein
MYFIFNLTELLSSYACTVLDRPIVFQQIEAFRISRQWEHEGDKVVSPMHQPPLPPRRYYWYSFLSKAEVIPGP